MGIALKEVMYKMNWGQYVRVVVKQWNLKKTAFFASKKGRRKLGITVQNTRKRNRRNVHTLIVEQFTCLGG